LIVRRLQKGDEMPKYLTVVYTINDESAFTNEREKLMSNFKKSEGEPWAITAMSIDHELDRLSFIEEAVAENDMDAIKHILEAQGVGDYENLEELRGA
jgi:hypothetical protein